MSTRSESSPAPKLSASDVFAEFLSLMSHGLAVEQGIVLPVPPLRSPADRLAHHATTHRLEGFLLKHRESAGLPPELIEILSRSELTRAQYGLILAGSTIELSQLFATHGIDHLIYKGYPLRLQSGAVDDRRGGGDVDILVAPSTVPRAHRLLADNGYHPLYAIGPKTPLGWRFLTYRNREMTYRSERVEVDLHWRVATDTDMLPDPTALLARKVFVGREGQRIPTLSALDAWAASAFHFYLDYGVLLRVLVDFVRLGRQAPRLAVRSLPRNAQAILADLTEAVAEVLHPSLVDRTGLPPANPDNVRALVDMVQAQAERRSTAKGMGSGAERFRRNIEHLSRYSSTPRLIPRLFARGLVWFPPASSHPRPVGMIRAAWLQLGRLRRGQFDSQV